MIWFKNIIVYYVYSVVFVIIVIILFLKNGNLFEWKVWIEWKKNFKLFVILKLFGIDCIV